jgi:hypothetical protein
MKVHNCAFRSRTPHHQHLRLFRISDACSCGGRAVVRPICRYAAMRCDAMAFAENLGPNMQERASKRPSNNSTSENRQHHISLTREDVEYERGMNVYKDNDVYNSTTKRKQPTRGRQHEVRNPHQQHPPKRVAEMRTPCTQVCDKMMVHVKRRCRYLKETRKVKNNAKAKNPNIAGQYKYMAE